MPMKPARACRVASCPHPVVRNGRCATHQQHADQDRAAGRTFAYNDAVWRRFRKDFVGLLVSAGILPVCGAALPGGPDTSTFSQCRAAGVLTFVSADGSALHVDHTPKLSKREHTDRAAITNPLRCCLLCLTCHSAKTVAEQDGGPANISGHGPFDTTPAPGTRLHTECNPDPGGVTV